jgi:sulfur carrier protein ThiS
MRAKEQLNQLEIKISKGLKLAYKKLLAFKKQKNTPLVISKDGKIVKLKPE